MVADITRHIPTIEQGAGNIRQDGSMTVDGARVIGLHAFSRFGSRYTIGKLNNEWCALDQRTNRDLYKKADKNNLSETLLSIGATNVADDFTEMPDDYWPPLWLGFRSSKLDGIDRTVWDMREWAVENGMRWYNEELTPEIFHGYAEDYAKVADKFIAPEGSVGSSDDSLTSDEEDEGSNPSGGSDSGDSEDSEELMERLQREDAEDKALLSH
jgi:hypothetical protein